MREHRASPSHLSPLMGRQREAPSKKIICGRIMLWAVMRQPAVFAVICLHVRTRHEYAWGIHEPFIHSAAAAAPLVRLLHSVP